ncbi:MAG TPA: hypothetical protein RMH26_28895 [Polyangiaceae bacterium LLY-WYZ-15_(1-7)]|nr:hypothetical protein [Polyangiaceae bacterium LLY-WYZ-15_(1-7)]
MKGVVIALFETPFEASRAVDQLIYLPKPLKMGCMIAEQTADDLPTGGLKPLRHKLNGGLATLAQEGSGVDGFERPVHASGALLEMLSDDVSKEAGTVKDAFAEHGYSPEQVEAIGAVVKGGGAVLSVRTKDRSALEHAVETFALTGAVQVF